MSSTQTKADVLKIVSKIRSRKLLMKHLGFRSTPVEDAEHLTHYIWTWMQWRRLDQPDVPMKGDLIEKCVQFYNFECSLDSGVTVKKGIDEHVQRLSALLRDTPAHRRLIEPGKLEEPLKPTKKEYSHTRNPESMPGVPLLELDLKSANFTMLKFMRNELIKENADASADETIVGAPFDKTFEEFAVKNGVPLLFAQSKFFRQLVFGQNSMNPKRVQLAERLFMQLFMEELEREGFLTERTFMRVLPDELLLLPDEEAVPDFVQRLRAFLERGLFGVYHIDEHFTFKMISLNPRKDGDDGYVKYEHDWRAPSSKLTATTYKVNGAFYWSFFRRFILGDEETDEYDLHFTHQGKLAMFLE